MEQYREDEIKEILTMIDRFLTNEIDDDEIAGWANLRMTEERFPGAEPQERDHIISDALGTLMMLSHSELEEFRSTREDLQQVISYLRGEEAFPLDRIPRSPPYS
jgi:hypothetical protein